MAQVSIRRQGGAAIMTIPAEVMKSLKLDIGAKLELAVDDDALVARPAAKTRRRRYSLAELLRGATPETMAQLNDEIAFAREGLPAGREF